jgi:hypothetical protein
MLKRIGRLGFLLVLLSFLYVSNAAAAPYLDAYSTVHPKESFDATGGGNTDHQTGTVGPITSSQLWDWTEYCGSLSEASARASYGQLGVYARNVNHGYASGIARFDDVWTISNSALNGTIGHLTLNISLEGSMTGSFSQGYLRILDSSGTTVRASYDFTSNTGGLTNVALGNLSFLFGKPFEFMVALYGFTAEGGEVSLGNTAWISGLTLTDTSGNAVTSYSLVSGSGTKYPLSAPVPAPAAILLFAPGILGLAGVRRFRNQKQAR